MKRPDPRGLLLALRYTGAVLFLGTVVCRAADAPAPQAAPPATLPELQQCIQQHIAQAKYDGALWGIKIVSLDSGKTVFEHNPQKLCSPASNCKLYTVALALDQLGADYRIRTSLYAKSRPRKSGTLRGDLVLYGRGDPTINARLHGGDIYAALDPLVTALSNAGVKRVSGDLIADESYFRGPPFGSGWMWDDLEYYYGAEISALTINDNVIVATVKPGPCAGAPCSLALSPATTLLTLSNWTQTVAAGEKATINFYRPLEENVIYVTGHLPLDTERHTNEITVHNPAGLFGSLFKQALARHGIKVSGKVRTVNWLDRQAHPVDYRDFVELGYVESLPMRDIAREVQKPSQNLYTDLLLAHVGEKARRADTRPGETSEDLGVRALNQFLAQVGLQRGETFFEEGSGLSRDNLAAPNATVALLTYMRRHKAAEDYIAALPIAGVDGTLRNRMKGTPAAGNVRAKTGTLRWANSISGYVTTAAGEHLVFSLMLNRYYELRPTRGDLDTIVLMLAGFTGRTN
ncbi:MAG TPA: D-alanyl-D-alanine carboxypeptidase/D-alanyl-D-alanine-endopeptidase [Candidatus Acidoferrum sp.]|nr:D-alanyl-D-alanine carboxypeptidase/D-alanyl-D-alanine-endopeptidase [Candidatus Acidoferrum sp.]